MDNSTVQTAVTVNLDGSKIIYTGPTSFKRFSNVKLSADLLTSAGVGIKGRRITITLGMGGLQQSCTTGVTTAAGAGSCIIGDVQVLVGHRPLVIKFAGDKPSSGNNYVYSASTLSRTVTVKKKA